MQHLLTDICSASKINRVDIQWTLKQCHFDAETKSIQSESFSLHAGVNYLFFGLVDSDNTTRKELHVVLYKCEEHQTATAKVFVLGENQKKHELVFSKKVGDYVQCWNGYQWLSEYKYNVKFIFDETLLNGNEKLVFFVELAYTAKRNETSFDVSRYCVTEKLQKLIVDDYSKINENEESLLQDNITFTIGNTKIKAHPLILGAASPYFSAMFRHKDFKENKERTVDLSQDSDVTLENFRLFLDVIYGCKNIQNIENQFLTQLCILADKYSVKELLEACQFFLSRTITVDNVSELLIFAAKYNCEFLKSKALIFGKENLSAIKQRPNFDDLYSNKQLLVQLL